MACRIPHNSSAIAQMFFTRANFERNQFIPYIKLRVNYSCNYRSWYFHGAKKRVVSIIVSPIFYLVHILCGGCIIDAFISFHCAFLLLTVHLCS